MKKFTLPVLFFMLMFSFFMLGQDGEGRRDMSFDVSLYSVFGESGYSGLFPEIKFHYRLKGRLWLVAGSGIFSKTIRISGARAEATLSMIPVSVGIESRYRASRTHSFVLSGAFHCLFANQLSPNKNYHQLVPAVELAILPRIHVSRSMAIGFHVKYSFVLTRFLATTWYRDRYHYPDEDDSDWRTEKKISIGGIKLGLSLVFRTGE